jgi:hypothetical protein
VSEQARTAGGGIPATTGLEPDWRWHVLIGGAALVAGLAMLPIQLLGGTYLGTVPVIPTGPLRPRAPPPG